ncbi:unnamed protein product [Prorocentrum cordatum]|uniref:Uncharacterized protein n=1 Tax=Prorocentrum cordatum TaxID=2364126 RepID=A0ABN9YCX3_9DINO|nr:unnamed protein product [Polarella glacialis]
MIVSFRASARIWTSGGHTPLARAVRQVRRQRRRQRSPGPIAEVRAELRVSVHASLLLYPLVLSRQTAARKPLRAGVAGTVHPLPRSLLFSEADRAAWLDEGCGTGRLASSSCDQRPRHRRGMASTLLHVLLLLFHALLRSLPPSPSLASSSATTASSRSVALAASTPVCALQLVAGPGASELRAGRARRRREAEKAW